MYKDLEELIKTEKLGKVSKEEAFKMGTNMLLKKCMENTDNIDVEELRKNWRKGVANLIGFLGLTHAAHYMGQPGVEQLSERQKSPTYQRIMKERAEKNKNREPSANLSPEDQVKQAREQARAEGQAIIDEYESKNKNKNIDSFLKAISLNESSGGKNTNHKQMKQGIHAGDSAVGQYGLMPNTIKEMARRMGSDNPMAQYAKMDNKKLAESIKKNPDHENQIANFMANHLHDKFGGDENKMAYSWFQGHNLTDNHFNTSHKDYQNHDYVKKYQKHKAGLEKKPESPQNPMWYYIFVGGFYGQQNLSKIST